MSTTQASTIQTGMLLPYMRDVASSEQSLQELSLMWRLIEASAKLNCPTEAKTILATLTATRTGLGDLERDLIATLAQEKATNVLKAIGTKAQYVIDIIVRNLFERTADVGFLATDSTLCAFVAGITTDQAAIRHRLHEYRNKYTVYNEIVLLDLQGKVLANIAAGALPEYSTDPLLAATLASDTYVETFRACDLRPGNQRSLVYSRRMHHPQTGAVVGVLCLCFDFDNEMSGIFHTHRDDGDRSIMLLLDAQNRVIASGQSCWIAAGTVVPSNREGQPALIPFCGRNYLIRTFGSDGYQGYPGPTGWQGQVMIPVDMAFSTDTADILQNLDPMLAAGLLSHSETFCPPLSGIMQSITTASDDIQRIVWNGHLLTTDQHGDMQKLKSVLEQIGETGSRSNIVFAQSVNNLFQTVLGASMRDAEFTSHLLVDLLDRNLYERADDCRWWALTPELRSALALPIRGAATLEKVQAALNYINGLYTVYTRIFLFDRDGCIIASTGEDDGAGNGNGMGSIDADSLAGVLRLRDDQQYHVSPFAETALYGGASTYIYHAALRAPDDSRAVVGGIGIVFDSTPEFANMLKAGLGGRPNTSAFFINRSGTILSGTDASHVIGTQLQLSARLLAVASGESISEIMVFAGQYAIAACTASAGYREFKVSDGYREDVIAVVLEFFGPALTDSTTPGSACNTTIDMDVIAEDGLDHATFFIGHNLLAIPADQVLQARPYAELRPASLGTRPEQIGLIDLLRGRNETQYVWVFDLGYLLNGCHAPILPGSQILILEYGAHTVGLLVDRLHAVPRFSPAQINQMPFTSLGDTTIVTQVIKANNGELLIQLVDVERLFTLLLHDIDTLDEQDTAHLRNAA